jgi:repressor LexA
MSQKMKNLTTRQEEILNLIKTHISDFGFPPTRADIAKTLGFRSPNAAEQHLRAIEKKGFIKILSGASRGIVLSESESNEIPVIGLVAAGGPILAQENIEKTIPKSRNLFSDDIDYYLRVKGDSMVEVGIYEEDLIGVSKSKDLKVGNIVVARINDEVTVKTLIEMSQTKVVLRPENQNYKDITINPEIDELAIEGSCVALVRESI